LQSRNILRNLLLLGSDLIYAAPHDVETERQGHELLHDFREVAAETADFVVETGNNEASVGTCSTMISLAASP
jgi:hypothetical protein